MDLLEFRSTTENWKYNSPVETATGSKFSICANGHCVTRVMDSETNSERDELYFPVFSIANWMIFNWWSILNEADDKNRSVDWWHRHCIGVSPFL